MQAIARIENRTLLMRFDALAGAVNFVAAI
jgi:hypothetical protein